MPKLTHPMADCCGGERQADMGHAQLIEENGRRMTSCRSFMSVLPRHPAGRCFPCAAERGIVPLRRPQ